jgi:phosphatidylinositol glycan class T
MWRYEKWGYPVESAPPGGLVLARFLPAVGTDIEAAWGGLTNALAGLFCASLDTLDKTQVRRNNKYLKGTVS